MLCAALTLGPAIVRADTPEETKAKALFQSGMKTYDVGDFEGALKLYTDAYQLAPRPGFLFNIAQCYRQLNNFERAAFFYQRFIDNSKAKAANVDLATQLLAEMKTRQTEKVAADKADDARKEEAARIAEEQRQAELKKMDAPLAASLIPNPVDILPPPPPPIEEDPAYKKWWFWTLIGVGVVAVAGGVTVGVVASRPGPQPRGTDLGNIGGHP